MQNIEISVDGLNDLIDKAKAGDVRSFELIVKSFQRFGMNVAFKILYNENDAREVIQDGFVKIWHHLHSYNSDVKFSTWMYKIIINLCFDKLKSKRRKRLLFRDVPEENMEFISGIDIEKELSDKQLVEIIKYLSKGLSEKQRVVFVLRDLEDMTINEVSEITGMPGSSVKTNLFLARQNIRKKLIGYLK